MLAMHLDNISAFQVQVRRGTRGGIRDEKKTEQAAVTLSVLQSRRRWFVFIIFQSIFIEKIVNVRQTNTYSSSIPLGKFKLNINLNELFIFSPSAHCEQ